MSPLCGTTSRAKSYYIDTFYTVRDIAVLIFVFSSRSSLICRTWLTSDRHTSPLPIECLLGITNLANQFRNRHSHLRLLQYRNTLLHGTGKCFFIGKIPSSFFRLALVEFLTFYLVQF